MAVFAFLFGLSMDYEVFILHRIRETHLDLTEEGVRDSVVPSVVTGISRTAGSSPPPRSSCSWPSPHWPVSRSPT
ncbi:hypothetical protein SGLAM104S_01858 [Streptomyces glaucescens]